jgi:restriction system protein
MARRTSPLEDLAKIASYLPWWVSLAIAVLAWFVLGAYAASEPTVSPEDPLGALSGSIPRIFATVGKYVLPLAFVAGAVTSLGESWRNGRLLRKVASHSHDPTARYHGQDVDPVLTMSWREFEHLVGEIYRRRGYSVVETDEGADGGVDLVARRNGETLLVQCKQWRTRDVGVSVVRELRGVVAARGATGGAVVTVGQFTQEARQFARDAGIELIDGDGLRGLARKVGSVTRPDTIAVAPVTPDTASGCPLCGASMVRRVAKRGASKGQAFLGCSRYPECRGTRPL